MDTRLADFIRDTPAGKEAEAILRSCVHCGFCTATCPTYQLLGDELDGPRGRIYLIKQVLEGKPVTEKTRLHLERCLTCRSCETTCPSGVKYSHLLDIGRRVVEEKLPRKGGDALMRRMLRATLPRPAVFRPAVKLGQLLRPLLPSGLADKLPPESQGAAKPWPEAVGHRRRMLALAGCVQPALGPNINAATARVLDRLGIELFEERKAGCCGAMRFHLSDQDAAKDDMRRNIDAWWPYVEPGTVEAIVMNASGCGVQVKEYGHSLGREAARTGSPRDLAYADKARRISELTLDLSELLPELADTLAGRAKPGTTARLAFHPPCTLQHGQALRGGVETPLRALGFDVEVARMEPHLCCGSAGTYSVLQPKLAYQLRDRKLGHLAALEPQAIVSANIGCIQHLQSGTATPVRHWVEVLDDALDTTHAG